MSTDQTPTPGPNVAPVASTRRRGLFGLVLGSAALTAAVTAAPAAAAPVDVVDGGAP